MNLPRLIKARSIFVKPRATEVMGGYDFFENDFCQGGFQFDGITRIICIEVPKVQSAETVEYGDVV